MIRPAVSVLAGAAIAACAQGTTYLIGADGAFLQPVETDGARVTGYFACAAPGPSCRQQAAEPCARFGLQVQSVVPIDVVIPTEASGFNFFPIKPNRKVTCAPAAEATL